MHFFYLDESGCNGADLNNGQQPIFVLGGVSVRDEGWIKTFAELDAIIKNYFQNNVPVNFELHANELLSPDGEGPFANHPSTQRQQLALDILNLLHTRGHDVHLIAIDKLRLSSATCASTLSYNFQVPYLLAYDYLITYVNWFVKEKLGKSARGLIILDVKQQFQTAIEAITHERRFTGAAAHRIKWISEFAYPVDSKKNPMVQLSDLVIFCARKFFEIEGGYRTTYAPQVVTFYAKSYSLIHERISRKTTVDRTPAAMNGLNTLLEAVRCKPRHAWKTHYGI